MAITAHFTADFDDFVKGTRDAGAALTGLEGQSVDFSKEFNTAFAGLDIQRLLTDPVDGASAAIEGLTGFLPPMAQGAIAAAGALTAVGTAVYQLASYTADTAAHLGDLSVKTGASVPELSRLSDAASIAGTDIDALGNVLYAMNRQMAQHPREFVAALKDIGLEFEHFKELK